MRRADRIATSIDVWFYPDSGWSISLSDDDGEIRCLGGDNDRNAAFGEACELADQYGVPARLLQAETREVIRVYAPPGKRG